MDGAGLLAGLVRDEAKRVKTRIQWEERTAALEGVREDIVDALREIVPHLPEKESKELVGTYINSAGRPLKLASFVPLLGR